ncbi:MAG: hypothetical protein M1822_006259 [Bathelium mastoideum]|nr:MAG: hypothetical protein M1822_006259 [Bathelium mastoideum]
MASQTSKIDPNAVKQRLDGDKRDIAEMWNDALKSYRGILGVQLERQFADTRQMIDFGTEQMNNFHKFRHNEKKVDKLRSLFAANLGYIQAGANQLVAAATPAFPPAAAIGTALTYMLKACKQVSADYDVVTSFFEDMNSFLQRITILETRLPKYQAYRNCLMDVFTSLLKMCGYATKYIELGRFKKWVLNMVRGEDSELGGARKSMDKSLDRLQSATEYAILGNTEELQKMNGELHENQEAQTRMLQAQTEMLESVLNSQDNVRSDLQNITKLLQVFQESTKSGDSAGKPPKGKAGTQNKPPTANRVVSFMPDSLNPVTEYRNIKDSYVADTCTWMFDEPAWNSWSTSSDAESHQSLLIISGAAGMGKSHLATVAYDHLIQSAGSGHESSTCVVHFYFRETEYELKTFAYAICWIVIQIAEQNLALCEKLNVEISREDLDIDFDDWRNIWNNLLARLFEAENGSRLQIIFDGIDELDDDEREHFLDFLKMIKDKTKLNVRIVCTTRPDVLPTVDGLSQATIDVEKEKVLPDLKALIWSRLDTLDRLRKFSRYVKQKIAEVLQERADCLLYAELMLRRFNANAREGAVLRALENSMPANLEDLYQKMLSECQRRTPGAQQQSLKVLIAWLAYSWRPLTLDECKALLKFVIRDSSVDLEEELEGRFSSFLYLGNSGDEDAGERTKTQLVQKTEELKQMHSNPNEAFDDGRMTVKFQTRSMRGFFRDSQDEREGLRVLSNEAHSTIFNACSQIVCTSATESEDIPKGLREYASINWASHLTWVNGEKLTETENLAFVESVKAVLMNEGSCAPQLEAFGDDYQSQSGIVTNVDNFLEIVSSWATWASCLDQSKLSPSAAAWAKNIAKDMRSAMVPLAKGHVQNWFKCHDSKTALRSFRFARSAMLLTEHKDIIEVDESDDDDQSTNSYKDKIERSAEEILGIAKAFNVEMNSLAHFAVGLVLENSSHFEQALTEAQAALSLCTDAIERSQILGLKAEILSQLERYSEAHDSIMEALSPSDLPTSSKIKALCMRASIEYKLGQVKESVQAYEEARLADPSAILPGNILKEEIEVLKHKNDYELVRTLEKWTPLEMLAWMTWAHDEDNGAAHEVFRGAIARTQEFDFLLRVYKEAIELLNSLDSAAPIQYDLALAHWQLRGDADATRATLDAILDSTSYGYPYALSNEEPSWILSLTINLVADVMYEQFRKSNDLERKEALLADTRTLTQRPLARSLTMWKSEAVHCMVTIARMARRAGTMREFHDQLQKAFALCYEALNDSVGWNDAASLESLAEVLLTVDSRSLEKEARIALSARFSELDLKNGNDSGTEPQQGHEDSDVSDSDTEDGEEAGGVKNEPHPKPKTLVNGTVEPDSSIDEYDTTGSECWCHGVCDPKIEWVSGWQGRAMYRCLICYNCNLCESCYELRQRLNNGETLGFAKHFCGSNHRYIKGPIEGWKGVKNGKMYIGDEEIPFRTWLQELKDVKWKQIWDTFWTAED